MIAAHKLFNKILVHNSYIKTNNTYIIDLNISQFFNNNQYKNELIQIKLYYNANITKTKYKKRGLLYT
jgi:hypothetical protein